MKRFLLAVALFLMMTGLISACGPSGPLEIESVTFYEDNGDGEPGDSVRNFDTSDEIFHVEIGLNQIASGLDVRLEWFAEDAGGMENFLITSADMKSLAVNTITGQLEIDGGAPEGDYRLDIYFNNELERSVSFEVR